MAYHNQRFTDGPQFLYHYTNTAGKGAILKSRQIKPSRFSLKLNDEYRLPELDLTTIPPADGSKEKVLKNYFGPESGFTPDLADWYFRFDREELRARAAEIKSSIKRREFSDHFRPLYLDDYHFVCDRTPG